MVLNLRKEFPYLIFRHGKQRHQDKSLRTCYKGGKILLRTQTLRSKRIEKFM